MRPFAFLARFSCVWTAQGLVQSVQGRHQDAGSVSESSTDDVSGASQIPARSGLLHPRQNFDARAAAKAAIDALNNKFYSTTEAIWSPGDPWWLSGVALTSVIDYMRKTGSRDYLDQVEHMIQVQRTQWSNTGGDFRGPSTDDTGWWALAMIRMYDLTGNDTYLDISVEDEAYMYDCWTLSPCGGGMFVDIATKTYKNAIANELYIKLAASLHNRIANGIDYLARAETAWSWFHGSGMIKNDSLINDGLTASSDGVCYNNNLPVWTYNQGVIIGALVELYQATASEAYLTNARTIADAVLSSQTTPQLTRDGILTEGACEPDEANGCNHDQQVFKGVFAYNLDELSNAIPDGSANPYRNYLQQNAQSAYTHARGEATDLYDVSWVGPFRNSTIGKQASAIGLLVAAI
ncbi:glycoside hydrolase [Chaetomium tenue]|uniref:Glycoside hydrolase n=1 Tax=Chaetomium tenue TaxID=1854479 RepID=A0ACB7P1W6_9PEZI|nr:glycoside hydrolase [Chaetomium globosum]